MRMDKFAAMRRIKRYVENGGLTFTSQDVSVDGRSLRVFATDDLIIRIGETSHRKNGYIEYRLNPARRKTFG